MKRAIWQVAVALLLAGGARWAQAETPDTLNPLEPVAGAALAPWADQVNVDRMMGDVGALVSFGTRHVGSAAHVPGQGIGAARRYIYSQFSALTLSTRLTVDEQEFFVPWRNGPAPLFNIIATLPGSDPAAGALVIGAHYDSINSMENAGYAPGANDNASGVAAVLELARVLSARPHRLSLIFVAFSAEEIGREGSIAFVRNYVPAHRLNIRAMINLDIIGCSTSEQGLFNDREIRLFSASDDDTLSRQMARALQAYGSFYGADLNIVVQDRLDRQGRFGDHQSFSDVGYPAVRFISAMENNWHQHTSMDGMDDVQPGYLLRAARTILLTAAALADGLPAPASIALEENGFLLSWDAVPEAQSYVIAVQVTGSLTFDVLYEVSASSTVVVWETPELANAAHIAVAARDAAGNIGAFSSERRQA